MHVCVRAGKGEEEEEGETAFSCCMTLAILGPACGCCLFSSKEQP